MRKLFCFIIASVLTLLSLTSCSNSDSKDSYAVYADISGQSGSISAAGTDSSLGDESTFGDLITFTAKDNASAQYSLSDFDDKDLFIINFWSTTCPPCINEMPELEELRKSLPERIGFLTFCLDGEYYPDALAEILADTGWSGITLVSGDGDIQNIINSLVYTPTTLFFSGDGLARGSAVIGAQTAEEYKANINNILSAMGKPTI